MNASLTLPKMDGREMAPHVYLIGEPTPVAGSDKMRCLANFYGSLAVVELSIKFCDTIAKGEPE